MHHNRVLTVLVTLFALVLAWNPPSYKGYTRKWSTNFIGKADASPGTGTWNLIARDNNYNNEFQRYSTNKRNLRLSGSGTLQLLPPRDGHQAASNPNTPLPLHREESLESKLLSVSVATTRNTSRVSGLPFGF